MRAFALAALLLIVGCDELGNPIPRVETVRSTESAIGRLETEVRLVAPNDLGALVRQLGSDLDHLDRIAPAGSTFVAVLVRPLAPGARPELVHLVTDLVLRDGSTERHVWVAQGRRSRYVAIFATHTAPISGTTTTL